MKSYASFAFVCGLAVSVLSPAARAVSIKDFGEVRVDGPFTHKNLAIYVLFVRERPRTEAAYLTLAEGIARGVVKITEDRRARVQRLLITNNSDRRVFLQVGEVVTGGKQDRTLQVSFVVPPKTPDVPIPSFCVEKTRWSGGGGFAAGGVIVPRSVKHAIQARSQNDVWGSVGGYKRRARALIPSAGRSRTSSVNEELSDHRFKKYVGGYKSALGGSLARFSHPLGMIYAVNGQISTVDVYHNVELFRKLFPKLLAAAAAEAAAAAQTRRGSYNSPDLNRVANFIAAGWSGRQATETLGLGNVYLRITGTNSRTGRLSYKSTTIHAQIVGQTTGPIVVPPRPRPVPRPRPPRPPYPMPRPRRE